MVMNCTSRNVVLLRVVLNTTHYLNYYLLRVLFRVSIILDTRTAILQNLTISICSFVEGMGPSIRIKHMHR